jgi:prepilin-type N-terminal cleavage/methylation domain-containing protein/prepilin-type processing-associated H-X9-DG protein
MERRMHRTRRQAPEGGFTLIELMVVIFIIGILVSILVPALQSAIVRAKDAKCKVNVKNLVDAARTYQDKYGKRQYYPPEVGPALWKALADGPPGKDPVIEETSFLTCPIWAVSEYDGTLNTVDYRGPKVRLSGALKADYPIVCDIPGNHGDLTINVAYFDSHVEELQSSETRYTRAIEATDGPADRPK